MAASASFSAPLTPVRVEPTLAEPLIEAAEVKARTISATAALAALGDVPLCELPVSVAVSTTRSRCVSSASTGV